MFPNVTPVKDESFKDKLKEKKWQERFAVKSTIPDYSPLKDRHTATYRKLLNNIVPKQKYQSTPNRSKSPKTYFEKKVELFEKLKELHPVYMSHLEEFQDFLTSSKLPNFYVYYSVLPLINEIDVNGFILKMRKAIKEQSSSYHRIIAAIKAREECLSQLKEIVSHLKPEAVTQQESKTKLTECLSNFRTLTANTIDETKRWRDALSLKEQRAIFYSQAQQNYLIKMLNDNQFLFSSVLSQFINFGEKNDPFVIVPLKKAEGKQASQFLSILETEKNLAYYQKYMEYLASQKAYQLSLVPVIPPPKRDPKYPEIQKIYKSKSTAKFETIKKQGQLQQNEKQLLQRQKHREQRLKKNQQRINAIKNVYESYSSKLKPKKEKNQDKKVETDVEEKTKREKSSSIAKSINKNSFVSDQQFDLMVRNKLENEKNKRLIFDQSQLSQLSASKQKLPLTQRQTLSSKSLTKLPRTQDKMIQNLKEIQQTLKSKLTFMSEESKKEESSVKKVSTTGEKFHKKTNEAIISELKSEIMKNLEIQNQQRELQRAKRRQEEQKAIEEIKQKMKKQMEEKLQQKKRQKLLERQQLEKKLKQQQNRLNKQRQLQMQLQLKLAKEKQLRQLEKLKREALEKQMKYKEQLQKQQRLRRQTEQHMQKQRIQKEKALEELKKKQLKENLQKQIKQEMKSKYGQNVKLFDKDEMNLLRQQKQQQLTKEIQLLKLKETQQIQQIRKENQLRERMLKLKKQQQELKRKQLQHLMKSVIQQEKQDLQRETLRKRIELQEEIKNNAKEKLLEEYKAEKEAILEKARVERERQLEEEVYREKVKEKIQKELRIQAIQRTKRQMQQRQARKYQISMKLQSTKNKFNQAVVSQFSKEKVQQQVKKQLIQKVIFDKQAQRESAKNDLRAQFEKELLASALPSIYQANDNDPILKKNIEKFKGDDYLRNKMTELDPVIKPTNQKAATNLSREDMFSGILSESPKKLPRNESMIRSITNEEKEIYSKKKSKVDDMRSQPSYKLPKKLSEQEEEGFQLVAVEKDDKDSEFDVKVIRKSSNKKQTVIEQRQSLKKKPKRKQQKDSQDEERIVKRNKKATNQSPSKKKYQSQEEDSQDQPRGSPQKRKILPKKKRESDEALSSDQEELRAESKRSSARDNSGIKRNLTYDVKMRQTIKKSDGENNNKKGVRSSQPGAGKVYYDAENPTKVNQMIPEQQKIQLRQVKHTAESRYQIKLQAIPQGELDQYLGGHFGQLPDIQRAIQLHDREELYRKLINQLTFCMLLGYQKDIIVGIALAFHDRNKTDSRKFTIVHFSTYKTQDLKDFLISCVNYIFRKDPVDEIEFQYKFNQSLPQQAAFSTDFNKWFDKYGNVYQKKVDEQVYQRKYVMKRQFNQKCDVVLGGVNKNTFRNLFSVYCGVVMSDADMIQFKDQLKSVVTPENEISYSIAIAQLFRTYLTPDEAQTLKGKVKEFAKLKQLLILVVMLQKKKVKMDELKLSEYKNLIELNMKLMSQGRQVIRYCKDSGMDLNRIYYAQLSQAFNLPFNFQTTSLPIESQQTGKIHQISYFRLSPLPPNKLHIIKSSLYNSELHILPTESTKYKLFVINAQEYNQIKQTNHLDIFMYIRLFLKNVKSHNTASWKYVWLPEMTDRANFNVREFKSFLNKDIYCHDSVNISYKQFLPNALIIEPQHRDLVITPPFIVGVMSMALEQVTEGSPLYARLIGVPALRTIEIEE